MTELVVRVALPESLTVWRAAGRAKLAEEGRCRMCERPSSVRPLTRHHLVGQAWFNRRSFVVVRAAGASSVARNLIRDCDANVVPLCAPCHAEVEDDAPTRRMLRRSLGAAEVALAVRLRGVRWFDVIYPPTRPVPLELAA